MLWATPRGDSSAICSSHPLRPPARNAGLGLMGAASPGSPVTGAGRWGSESGTVLPSLWVALPLETCSLAPSPETTSAA